MTVQQSTRGPDGWLDFAEKKDKWKSLGQWREKFTQEVITKGNLQRYLQKV